MDCKKIISLRMERQCLLHKAKEDAYAALYRDLQPGQNVYWNGFGDPPSLTFRADFDDIEFNRARQARRALVKGRFAGGNLGWIEREEMALFACLYRKPLDKMTQAQAVVLELIAREGPLNIQQMKAETGMLVKEITPVLHRLQEAFLVYEDQHDGEWDRGWHMFAEIFPDVDFERYTRVEALKHVLLRFAYRHVVFDAEMARSFYKLPARDIKAAIASLTEDGALVACDGGWMLREDAALLETYAAKPMRFVHAIHRNDFLYKSNEHVLKQRFGARDKACDYDCEPLQYLLIDGEFHGASLGRFRNGPYDLNDVACDLPDAEARREEILDAIAAVNGGRRPLRFMGRAL